MIRELHISMAVLVAGLVCIGGARAEEEGGGAGGDALDRAAGQVHDWIEANVGRSGGVAEQPGVIDRAETVLMFTWGYRAKRDEGYAKDTGIDRVAGFARISGGVGGGFDLLASSGWHERMANGLPVEGVATDRLGAELLDESVDLPDLPGSEELPLAAADATAGVVAFRSGWATPSGEPRDEPWLTTLECGTHHREGVERVGNLALTGGGRAWLVRHPIAEGVEEGNPRWVDREDQNAMGIVAAGMGTQRAMYPTARGRVDRLRASRDGSGSASIIYGPFSERRIGSEWKNTQPPETGGKAWRTLGVDYSGQSGLPVVLITLDTVIDIGPRQRVWQADLGDVTADEVTIHDHGFTVRPSQSHYVMDATFPHPASVMVEYVPREEQDQGGIIRVWLREREKEGDGLLEGRIAGGIDAPTGPADFDGLDPADPLLDGFDPAHTLETEAEKAARIQRQKQRQQDAGVIQSKIHRHTSSVKMGAGDRGPRSREALLGIITLRPADGPPPTVRVLGETEDAIVSINGIPIEYRENILLFPTSGATSETGVQP